MNEEKEVLEEIKEISCEDLGMTEEEFEQELIRIFKPAQGKIE